MVEAQASTNPGKILTMNSRYVLPARFLLWSQIGIMGVLWLLQSVLQKDLHAVERVFWGFDYNDYHQAAQAWRAGGDPYNVSRFLTPPLSAALCLPLAGWSMETVRPFVAGAFTLVLSGSVALLGCVFVPREARRELFFTAVGTLFLSYPFLFLFERMNVDGFVMGFVALFLWATAREQETSRWGYALLAGVALSFGIGVKLYPALLLLPLLITRRWKVLGSFFCSFAILVASMSHLWQEFLQSRLAFRSQSMAMDENGSLANTFRFIGERIATASNSVSTSDSAALWAGWAMWIFVGLLLLKSIFDWRRWAREKSNAAQLAIWYVPFMVAVPKTVYHYELVALWLMLPAMGERFVCSKDESGALRLVSYVTIFGLILSQTHAVAFKNLFDSWTPHFVPGIGLFLILLTSTLQSVLLEWRSAQNTKREKRVVVKAF